MEETDQSKFSESSIIVTGAGKGIGRQIALSFARQLDRPLVLLARSKDKLEKVEKECIDLGAEQVMHYSIDLTDREAVNDLELSEPFNRPGIVVNNAGYFLPKPISETTNQEYDTLFSSNVDSAYNVIQRFLDGMKKLNRALIINICSLSAVIGKGECGIYSSSKHALLGLTRSLREELKPTNVGVTAINLGQTYSSSWEGVVVDPKRIIDASDVGRMVVMMAEMAPQTTVDEIKVTPQHGELPPEQSW